MISLTYSPPRYVTVQVVIRSVAVSLLLGIVWIYLAVVFSPVWVPYRFATSAYRLSRHLGIF